MDLSWLSEYCDELERALGLPSGFVVSLPSNDDWSFLIKVSALVEASCTELLLSALAENRLAARVTRLRLQGPEGKIRWLRDLELATAADERLVGAVYALRNLVAHDVRRVRFSFADHFAQIGEQKTKDFGRALYPAINFPRVSTENEATRIYIIFPILNLLASQSRARQSQKAEHHLLEMRSRLFAELMNSLSGLPKDGADEETGHP